MKHPHGTEAFDTLPHPKKERIYQAAVSEFAERGFGKASMNRLVEAAGISKGSLFVYFKSKSGLFDAIIDLAVNRIKEHLREVRQSTADDPFSLRISALLRSGFRFVDQYPKLAKIYFELLQSNDAPKSLQKMVQTLNWQSTRFIASFIEDGIKREELNTEIDVVRTAFLINALFEKLLRSYYSEHLAPEAGLYAADAINIDNWVQSTVNFATFGVSRFSKGEF
ncbi:TetR/AcrR family transcriptional regulator [bacterium]|nr:TetR/AcrR family transcriptional regulator [bacterium]